MIRKLAFMMKYKPWLHHYSLKLEQLLSFFSILGIFVYKKQFLGSHCTHVLFPTCTTMILIHWRRFWRELLNTSVQDNLNTVLLLGWSFPSSCTHHFQISGNLRKEMHIFINIYINCIYFKYLEYIKERTCPRIAEKNIYMNQELNTQQCTNELLIRLPPQTCESVWWRNLRIF